MKTAIIVILVVFFLGISAGCSVKKSGEGSGADAKKLQDATAMMKEQSANIKKMGEMMISIGLAVQDMGTKYKDDELASKGKDLEAVGKKYIEENAKAEEKDASMKSGEDGGTDAKKLQDATAMMKEQSANIKKMGEMMISIGLAIQEMGVKYKDDELASKGKDLEAVGKKYIEENAKAKEKDPSMKKSMD